jgi:hypothetical protein
MPLALRLLILARDRLRRHSESCPWTPFSYSSTGKLPNVALMRIAAHHRALGDTVELRRVGNPSAVALAAINTVLDKLGPNAPAASTRRISHVRRMLATLRPGAYFRSTRIVMTSGR